MYIDRVKKLQKLLKNLNVDALYVSDFHNIVYLTGCKTLSPHERESHVLVTQKNTYFFTDSRYEIALKARIVELNNHVVFRLISPQDRLFDQILAIMNGEELQSLGFESHNLTHAEYQFIQQKLTDKPFIPVTNLIAQLRTVKDAGEIDLIRSACRLTDQCLVEVTKQFKYGMKEQEAAYLFEKWIREHGYEMAFDPMVAFDDSGALPHYDAKNGKKILQEGTSILIDFGIKYQEYVSDISRMFFMNYITDEMRIVYESLRKIQEETILSIGKQSTTFKDIDTICRSLVTQEGLPQFAHAVGHGLGMEVHEKPVVSHMAAENILPGHIFTIEPGIYREGKYGMRIEDTVAILADGSVEILTQFPKDLAILQA